MTDPGSILDAPQVLADPHSPAYWAVRDVLDTDPATSHLDWPILSELAMRIADAVTEGWYVHGDDGDAEASYAAFETLLDRKKLPGYVSAVIPEWAVDRWNREHGAAS
jgi:hypothetical protein